MRNIILITALVFVSSSVFAEDAKKAEAKLSPLNNSGVSGHFTFAPASGGIHITGELQGLRPSAKQGFHIHEKGDCSAPDGSSAGPHFAHPESHHGGPTSPNRHLGDLGNIMSDSSGKAAIHAMGVDLAIDGPSGVIGHSIVVHAGEDDLKTDPAGNSGARVACGVIEAAKD